jgi:hypothetical protein
MSSNPDHPYNIDETFMNFTRTSNILGPEMGEVIVASNDILFQEALEFFEDLKPITSPTSSDSLTVDSLLSINTSYEDLIKETTPDERNITLVEIILISLRPQYKSVLYKTNS